MSVVDPGLLIAGFRGALFFASGARWGQCTQWALTVSITSTDEQPLGMFWVMSVAQSGSATLTVSELVIDDWLPRRLLEGIADVTDPHLPMLRFVGERYRPDGAKSRIVIDQCSLDGDIPIAMATPGETMSRDLSFRVNLPPDPSNLFPDFAA